jgi:hypothetical protein
MAETQHLMHKVGSRVFINSCVHAGAENYICSSSSSGGAQEKRKDRMKLSLPTKISGGRKN